MQLFRCAQQLEQNPTTERSEVTVKILTKRYDCHVEDPDQELAIYTK